ncbi:hypothetical protein, partial [Sphingomonas jinjuensis]
MTVGSLADVLARPTNVRYWGDSGMSAFPREALEPAVRSWPWTTSRWLPTTWRRIVHQPHLQHCPLKPGECDYLFLVGGPTFGALFYGWQAWDRAHWWRSAEAVTVGSDYSEAERLDDRRPFASLRLRPFTDARSGRYTKVRIDYADAAGRHHQATVIRVVTRGKTVMPTMRIFYDTRDPDRVNLDGLRSAAFLCVFWVSCPLLSGPSTMTVWIKEGTTNAFEEAQARG